MIGSSSFNVVLHTTLFLDSLRLVSLRIMHSTKIQRLSMERLRLDKVRLEDRERIRLERTRRDLRNDRGPRLARRRDGALKVLDVARRIRKRRGRLDQAEVVLNDTETARGRIHEDNQVVKGNIRRVETTIEEVLRSRRTVDFDQEIASNRLFRGVSTKFLGINFRLECILLGLRARRWRKLRLPTISRRKLRARHLRRDGSLQRVVRGRAVLNLLVEVGLQRLIGSNARITLRVDGRRHRALLGFRNINLLLGTTGRLRHLNRDRRVATHDRRLLVLDEVEVTRQVDDNRVADLDHVGRIGAKLDPARRLAIRDGDDLLVRADLCVGKRRLRRRLRARRDRANVRENRRGRIDDLGLDRLLENALISLVLLGDKGTLRANTRKGHDFGNRGIGRCLGSHELALNVKAVLGRLSLVLD